MSETPPLKRRGVFVPSLPAQVKTDELVVVLSRFSHLAKVRLEGAPIRWHVDKVLHR